MTIVPLLVTVPMGVAVGGLFTVTVAQAYHWLPRPDDVSPTTTTTTDREEPSEP